MRGKTHMLTGQVFWLGLAPAVCDLRTGDGWGLAGVGLAVATLGALGPDIDHAKSTATHALGSLGTVLSKVTAKMVGGHRMGTHSALSVMLAWLAAFGLVTLAHLWVEMPTGSEWVLAWAFGLGWFAHIFGDLLTVQGVGLLYPMTRRRIRLLHLRTSNSARLNFGEAVFNVLLVLVGVYFVAALLGGTAA